MLLIAAEAANEKGLTGKAAGYLEQVRAHARGTLANVLPKVESASQSMLVSAIRHERRVELALEPDRFYDLVRWGIAKDGCKLPERIPRTSVHSCLCPRQR